MATPSLPRLSLAAWGLLACAALAHGHVTRQTRSLHQPRHRLAGRQTRPLLAAATSGPVVDDGDDLASAVERTRTSGVANALYKFSRPHTIRGTILASFAGVSRALIEHPSAISLRLVPQALLGLLALGLGNIYIVGINQIYDVDVDKINKPFLPVAAGEISPPVAWTIVLASLAGGLATVWRAFSPLIFSLYSVGLAIGGLYSVPPIQLKRFPIAASLIISTVRGFLLNFGVYYAVREAIGVPFRWNPVVCFIASFMTVFAAVIAVTKDLPDVAGDAAYDVKTFATRFGVQTVARGACAALGTAYAGATALALLSPAGMFRRVPMAAGHALLGLKLLRTYGRLDATSLASIKRFYGGVWQVFYLQYVLYPFI
jgi:homogentisate solanesyltransferase